MKIRLIHWLMVTSTAALLLEVYRILFLAIAFERNCKGCAIRRQEKDIRAKVVLENIRFALRRNRKRTLTSEDIMIAINTAPEHVFRINNIHDTWGFELSNSLRFYGCPEIQSDLSVMVKDPNIPCVDYPPVKSWLFTIKHMAQYESKSWFLKCDDDTYVNIPQFLDFVQSLEDHGLNPEDPYYFGSIGYGREQERPLLGLNNTPFVMGGPCVGLSAGAIQQLMPIIDECMHEYAVRMHSDTQLARCMLKLNVTAGLPIESEKRLRGLFKQFYIREAAASHDGTVVAPFESSTVPPILPPSAEPQVTLHSIKDRLLMFKIHAQLRYHALPIPLRDNRAVIDDMKCSHNPMMVKSLTTCRGMGFSPYWTEPEEYKYHTYAVVDRCSKEVPECPVENPTWSLSLPGVAASQPESESDLPVPVRTIGSLVDQAYILCLDVEVCQRGRLYLELQRLNMPVRIVQAIRAPQQGSDNDDNNNDSDGKPTPPPAAAEKTNLVSPVLTLGEMAVRASFAKIFRMAMSSHHRSILVFEEDAMLHHNFSARLPEVLSCPRCGCHLVRGSGCTPGILFLGMTVWTDVTLRQYDQELLQHGTPCVNLLPNTYGAFAAIYNVDILPFILYWLESQIIFPFDWVHTFLSIEGFIIRGLRRPLAIANLDHNSTVKPRLLQGNATAAEKRYHLHDWPVAEFLTEN